MQTDIFEETKFGEILAYLHDGFASIHSRLINGSDEHSFPINSFTYSDLSRKAREFLETFKESDFIPEGDNKFGFPKQRIKDFDAFISYAKIDMKVGISLINFVANSRYDGAFFAEDNFKDYYPHISEVIQATADNPEWMKSTLVRAYGDYREERKKIAAHKAEAHRKAQETVKVLTPLLGAILSDAEAMNPPGFFKRVFAKGHHWRMLRLLSFLRLAEDDADHLDIGNFVGDHTFMRYVLRHMRKAKETIYKVDCYAGVAILAVERMFGYADPRYSRGETTWYEQSPFNEQTRALMKEIGFTSACVKIPGFEGIVDYERY